MFFVSQGQPGSAAIEHLDYGLYWYGYNNNCEKFVNGQGNQYYDPSKPVVIYCHGWQNGTSVNGYARENFHFVHGDADAFVHHSWLEKGWNMGVFYWTRRGIGINPRLADKGHDGQRVLLGPGRRPLHGDAI